MGISLGGNDRLTRLEGEERTWIEKENNIYLTNSYQNLHLSQAKQKMPSPTN